MGKSNVTDSQFAMWRTLFAVTHADDVVTDEEIGFMAHVLEGVDFTDEQTAMLKDDIVNPKDVEEMFKGITEQGDRSQFFQFANDLVWVDGDFASEEQNVMIKLSRLHFDQTDVDEMVGQVSLELEEEGRDVVRSPSQKKGGTLRDRLFSFRKRFLEGL